MKKINSITAAAALLAFAILVSRILGYLREMLLAYQYGASATTDAFYAAFQIPDLLNYFLAGGALSIAFIPLYHRAMAKGGTESAQKLFSTVLGTVGVTVIALTVLLYYFSDSLIAFQFSAFDPATQELAAHLTRIVLPAQIFFIIGGILQAVLLAERHFLAAALSPLVYNVCIILGGFLLHPFIGIDGFAWGTLAGAFLGPFLLPLLMGRKILKLKPVFAPFDRVFFGYLIVATPLMFGQTLLTVDEWLGRWFGALLDTGTVAHLSYARRLMQVPIAVIGQAIAAAALPTLAKLWAEGRTTELNSTLSRTLNLGLVLAMLCVGGMAALSLPLVETVYQQGAFTAQDSLIVAGLVMILSLAIPAWILQQIVLRGFYAREETFKPMLLCTLMTFAAVPVYLSLSRSWQAEGLALAGVICMTVSALALLVYARARHGAPSLRGVGRGLLLGGFAALPAAALSHMYFRTWQSVLSHETWHPKWVSVIDLGFGGFIYGATALAFILVLVYLQRHVTAKQKS